MLLHLQPFKEKKININDVIHQLWRVPKGKKDPRSRAGPEAPEATLSAREVASHALSYLV